MGDNEVEQIEPIWLTRAADPKNFVCRCGMILPLTDELKRRNKCYAKTRQGHDTGVNSDGAANESEASDDRDFSPEPDAEPGNTLDQRTAAEVARPTD